ncbi:MAG TPA: sugar transferase [Verrucomicrobiota bacterium]|nr:sugar transferase [Verrucomicrobiota bacterium]
MTATGTAPSLEQYFNLILVGAGFLLASFVYLRLYSFRHLLRFRRAALIVVKAVGFWFVAYLSASLVLRFDPPISRLYVAASVLTTLAFVLLWRRVLGWVVQTESVAAGLRQRVLFVGWNKEADRMAQAIVEDPIHPYDIVGCVPSAQGRYALEPRPGIPQLGDYNELPVLLESDVDMVIAADLDPVMGEMIALANLCERSFVQFKVIPSYFQILVSGLQLETVSGVPILGVERLPLDSPMNRGLKRGVDIVGALVGLALSAPIVAWCAWRIRREDPGPVFFGQERIGRNGRPFTMWKLRSMRQGAEKLDHLSQSTLREDPRVLEVGRWMRRLNLDEVPQFWNVLRGEMSLVGPRPERTYHSEKLSAEIPHYNARYASKPGMTGWAQVNGFRGEGDLVGRVRYDLFYLENWTLLLDFQIMCMTFVSRKNAY